MLGINAQAVAAAESKLAEFGLVRELVDAAHGIDKNALQNATYSPTLGG